MTDRSINRKARNATNTAVFNILRPEITSEALLKVTGKLAFEQTTHPLQPRLT